MAASVESPVRAGFEPRTQCRPLAHRDPNPMADPHVTFPSRVRNHQWPLVTTAQNRRGRVRKPKIDHGRTEFLALPEWACRASATRARLRRSPIRLLAHTRINPHGLQPLRGKNRENDVDYWLLTH